MDIFRNYSQHYDSVYLHKDYPGEALWVIDQLTQYNSSIDSLVDLGCGSGRHIQEFSKSLGRLVGVDQSREMIECAKTNNLSAPSGVIDFVCCSIDKFCFDEKFDEKFDAAVLLFHVVSYLIEQASFQNMLENTRHSLSKGGLVAFDFWNNQAVLKFPPEKRSLEFAHENERFVRTVEPSLVGRNTYSIKITVQSDSRSYSEDHVMRAYDQQELMEAARAGGFEPCCFNAAYSDKELGVDDWIGWTVWKKRE